MISFLSTVSYNKKTEFVSIRFRSSYDMVTRFASNAFRED